MGYFDRKDDFWFIKWAKAVKIRDRFTCQVCFRQGVELNSHHKNAWNWCIDERYDIDNGITLCSHCHDQFHTIYGHGDNTEEQFQEFSNMSESMRSSIERKIMVESATKQFIQALISDGYASADGYADGYS